MVQEVAEKKQAAGASRNSSAKFTIKHLFYAILLDIVITGISIALFLPEANHDDPEPRLFVRLVEARGLDPIVPETEVRSPAFDLAVDVGRVSESSRGPCARGGDAMLRVSYRGTILAWGGVPPFCAGVATVVAAAEGLVLQQELRNRIWAETYALGRAEFDVEGRLPGLGHLRCKTYLFRGDSTPTEAAPPCSFH